jgi:hypothetical protein
MAMISSKAMRNFAPCNMFSSETADALEKDFNFQCVTFKDSIEPDVGVALRCFYLHLKWKSLWLVC